MFDSWGFDDKNLKGGLVIENVFSDGIQPRLASFSFKRGLSLPMDKWTRFGLRRVSIVSQSARVNCCPNNRLRKQGKLGI